MKNKTNPGVIGTYRWQIGGRNAALRAFKLMQDKEAEVEQNKRIEEASTGLCADCDGYGSLQFCGGMTCPRCNGSGKPLTK
jgi:hypothetical protein